MKLILTAPADVFRWEDEEEYDEDESLESETESESESGEGAEYEVEDDDDEFDESAALEFEVDDVITDPDILSGLGGVEYDGKLFADVLSENEETAALIGIVSGGVLGFDYSEEDQQLWGYTEYDVSRELNDEELQLLIDFTIAQWSDIGEDFASEYAEESGYLMQINPPDDEVSYYYEEDE